MTRRVRSRCRAEKCRSKAVMIALVDDAEGRFGVCLCRPHGLMWLTDRFRHFRLKPHTKPDPEPPA